MELAAISVVTVKTQGFAAEVCTAHINETVVALKTCRLRMHNHTCLFMKYLLASFPGYAYLLQDWPHIQAMWAKKTLPPHDLGI